MKKQLIVFTLAALSLSAISAEEKPAWAPGYGMAGCGFGSLLLGDKPGIIQIFAATTNGIYGNQTFAITSGTSNCTGGSSSADAKIRQQEIFVQVNYKSLQQEMAAGRGEKLGAFAGLLGCPVNRVSEFGVVTREETIFSASTPESMLSAVKTALHDSDLSCTNI